ncbi:MAG: heavy metal translocating P-type ATPase [Leptolyngbyaceae bacterium]|nr:heavy metal translocating P-type ATPase [Leptolyngbyaceae bacterium]
MPVDSLKTPISIATVAHAIPGRIRLRLAKDQSGSMLSYLEQQLKDQGDGWEIRANQVAHSLTLTFDADRQPLDQVVTRLQKLEVIASPSKIAHPSIPASDRTLATRPEKLSSLRSWVPLAAGILVTRGLGVTGFMAFPVYLVAESMTSQVMKQLESQLQPLLESEVSEEVVNQPNNQEFQGKSGRAGEHAVEVRPKISYQVVHTIPGRIRVRVPALALLPDYGHKLTLMAEADDRVTQIRINSIAQSVTIHYAPDHIPTDEIRSYLSHLLQSAQDVVLPVESTLLAPEPEADLSSWLNLQMPALTLGLAILGGPMGVPIPPILMVGSIAISAFPIVQRAFQSLWVDKRLNIDVLDFLAIAITTWQGRFLSPAMMIALVEIGEAIRDQTARSSKIQVLDLLGSLKQWVWVERNGDKQQIDVHQVQQGDVVIVYPGEQIPVDGHILRGKALIDEQKLTGEAKLVLRQKKQSVYASTLVREGQIYVQTEQVGAATRAGKIIQVMQEAPVHDTRIENYAAAIADRAVVPTLIGAGLVLAATRDLARAASILTLDFATGIRVSVPTAVLAALTYAARRGILIRSGRALEKLAQVNAVVFDKTGTLTRGEPAIVGIESASDAIAPMQVLELAVAAEQRLTHPVAIAIENYAQEQGARILPRDKWDYLIGLGVQAKINGQTVLVGSPQLLRQEGIDFQGLYEKHQASQSAGNSVIYVASNGEIQGAVVYRDPLRAESQRVVALLGRREGMEIHLLTGDNLRVASVVAQELGIPPENTHARAFPEQKVEVVRNLHEQGKTVAFVGDGINDSPALAYADVSVSFGNGSDVARETADVVLMENSLLGFPEAIQIARQAMDLIQQNTGIVAVPNLGAMGLAIAVGLDPLAATIVNNGSTIVAGLNGLRPLLTEEEPIIPSLELDLEDLDLLPESAPELPKPPEAPEISEQPTPSETSLDETSLEPLTGRDLAHRLGVSDSTITRRRAHADFSEWTRRKDPDGITWTYSQESHLYVPQSGS